MKNTPQKSQATLNKQAACKRAAGTPGFNLGREVQGYGRGVLCTFSVVSSLWRNVHENGGGIESQLRAKCRQFSDEANRLAPSFWNEME
jgi:hypothetical protein